MTIGEICNRSVVIVEAETTVSDAAAVMREAHVGSVVIVRGLQGARRPTGLVTDRDIVVEVVARRLDPATLRVGEIVTRPIQVIDEGKSVGDALDVMRAQGVRRLPVVNNDGTLVGIATLDDLLELVTEELTEIVATIAREQAHEARVLP